MNCGIESYISNMRCTDLGVHTMIMLWIVHTLFCENEFSSLVSYLEKVEKWHYKLGSAVNIYQLNTNSGTNPF